MQLSNRVAQRVPRVLSKNQGVIWAGRHLHTVSFSYTKADGTLERYPVIEPYSFRQKNGVRYFYGYNPDRESIRSYVWDRVRRLKINKETYVPQWEVEF